MKGSRRQLERIAQKAAKLARGKPAKSQYAAKGGPYGYEIERSPLAGRRER